ncbi:MAG: chromate efflux transporter [Rhizobiaceae bacterium]|nr:chromate efflux transporter [Rhizobiaceae bacterium]
MGTAGEVFGAFLRLGLTAFGGPIAHLGYFRTAFVEKRRWLSEADYADLIALCQFLPGPTSSQVGFALGLKRAGPLGGLAAWAAFTLPSVCFLLVFASLAETLGGPAWEGLLQGLKIVAVAVVAQAVWGMAHSLCPDGPRAGIAVAALAAAALLSGVTGQLSAIGIGLLAGLAVLPRTAIPVRTEADNPDKGRRTAIVAMALFVVLLVLPPLLSAASGSALLALFDANYRAGALVFGGGHVVLPLLESAFVPRFVTESQFLAGYGAVQAMPGPLFTFGAYLGAVGGGFSAAAVALLAIFLPGLLLVVAALPFWQGLRERPRARQALAGINAAVVGLLAAALYDPIWTSAVLGPLDFVSATAGFLALVLWRVPPLAVVVALALTGLMRGVAGL